jgi:hypothetical protein
MQGIQHFCIIQLQHLQLHTVLFLLTGDNSRKSNVHKRIILSEFIFSVLGSYVTRLPQLYISNPYCACLQFYTSLLFKGKALQM